MTQVITGLERVKNDSEIRNIFKGNIGLLCHSASIDLDYNNAIDIFKEVFQKRLVKVFGPQHGFVSDVQDNMIETDHYEHSFYKLPIYSLYSETRSPTKEMLEGIDTFVIDLQDVGTRVYTYITTMTYILKECSKQNIKVVILDRPNPVGGDIIEGNLLEKDFLSFVGCMPIPQRHSLTMGEMAELAKRHFKLDIDLEIVSMQEWKREMFWDDTKLPWINPSPNLPTWESSLTFCGTVLFEGTNISEGRGTTRSLEVIGHPKIEPFSLLEEMTPRLKKLEDYNSFKLRPIVFMPTFQKHSNTPCGGFHIHIKDKREFKSWRLSQFLCKELYNTLGTSFEWTKKAYEYEYEKLPIDLINGNEKTRKWIESNGSLAELKTIEATNIDFYESIKEIRIY